MRAKLKPIILIIVAAILLLGGVWFFLHQSTTEEKTKELSADEIIAMSVKTENITTNLSSGGYVQLSFQLQTDSEKAKRELEKRDFQVKNVILKIFSSLTEDEINSPEETVQFEEQIKNEMNKLMQSGHIVKVYTTNKMIQ
jgi:flagellar protein FliL